MKGVHHNWLEALLVCSQMRYFDETWKQEKGIKGFAEVQCQEGEWYYKNKTCKCKKN